MISNLTVNDLKKFEEEIATLFNGGSIRAPVHLFSGNEQAIYDVFIAVHEKDWVFCSWRSHLQCLLKGVPAELLRSAILDGKSISLCFPEYRIFSSAIVGGQLPIAVGVAMSIKMKAQSEHVYCFLGDMTSQTGMASVCIQYATNYDLPITFIIEDNDLSVMTPTRKVWNSGKLNYEVSPSPKVISYRYQNKWPHAGAGVRVQF